MYSAKDGEHKFVAYAVQWKQTEVIVSDHLANSAFKVGDTIEFDVTKVGMKTTSSPQPVSSISFTLVEPNAPKSSN
jgi:hypothetical protein